MTKSSYWIPDCHFWQLSPAWCRQCAMWSGSLRCITGALLTGVLCSGSKERSSISNSCTIFPTQAKALCSMYCWKALSPAAKVPLTLGRRGRRRPHTLYTSPSQYRSQHTHGNGRSTLFQKVLHTTIKFSPSSFFCTRVCSVRRVTACQRLVMMLFSSCTPFQDYQSSFLIDSIWKCIPYQLFKW